MLLPNARAMQGMSKARLLLHTRDVPHFRNREATSEYMQNNKN